MRPVCFFSLAFFAFAISFLAGCSHLFLDSETRLQVENATDDCTIFAIDVVSEDGSDSRSWIRETIPPGERSHVVEADWVGEFSLKITYAKSADAKGNVLEDIQKFDFEGGSLYMRIRGEAESLVYDFK